MKKVITFAFALCCAATALAQWAQVNLSVANVRTQKGESQELCTQEYMGMPVKVLGEDGRWSQVETTDGYKGWISSGSLVKKTDAEMAEWRQAPRYVVTALTQVQGLTSPLSWAPNEVVTDFVPCDIVVGNPDCIENGKMLVTLPDAREAWVDVSALTPIETWANQPFNSDVILYRAKSILGTPYLWGGNSVKGLDCSGLAKYCYLSNGIFLRRDASMQARTGQPLDLTQWAEFLPADLLFFGNAETGKVTHVAIYEQDGQYVHSSGRGDRVGINSLDPEADNYGGRPAIKAVRIQGSEGTPGIVKASQHPWLF